MQPAGPKTIHFWAPTWKWMLIVASLSDFRKPASHISLNQNLALAATGLIWSRYATQINPVNWNLFAVNVFVFLSSAYQLYRIYQWKQEEKALGLSTDPQSVEGQEGI